MYSVSPFLMEVFELFYGREPIKTLLPNLEDVGAALNVFRKLRNSTGKAFSRSINTVFTIFLNLLHSELLKYLPNAKQNAFWALWECQFFSPS